MQTMKRCSKCEEPKPITDFWNAKKYKDGKYPSCKDCQRKTTKSWHSRNKDYYKHYLRRRAKKPNYIWRLLKATAKRRGISFELNENDFINWFNTQDKICVYCKLPQSEIPKIGDPNLRNRLSIDRIECSKGYLLSNIVLACCRCNMIKSDLFTFDEMKEIGAKYVEPKWRNKVC